MTTARPSRGTVFGTAGESYRLGAASRIGRSSPEQTKLSLAKVAHLLAAYSFLGGCYGVSDDRNHGEESHTPERIPEMSADWLRQDQASLVQS
jgi:hypothetical protein